MAQFMDNQTQEFRLIEWLAEVLVEEQRASIGSRRWRDVVRSSPEVCFQPKPHGSPKGEPHDEGGGCFL